MSQVYRSIEGEPDDPGERLTKAGIGWYRDGRGSLHARCGGVRLAAVLSGVPGEEASDREPLEAATEWLTLTDIAATIAPWMQPWGVNPLLAKVGLVTRVGSTYEPTEAAKGLHKERRIERYGVVNTQRMWAFEVLAPLRAVRLERKPLPPKRMTERQEKFLKVLCEKTGEPFWPDLTIAEASERIDALRERLRAREPPL